MDSQEESFSGPARLELMGHRLSVGQVETVLLAGQHVFKVTKPAEGQGAELQIEYYASGSLYCLTPISQEELDRYYARRASYALPAASVSVRVGRPFDVDGDYDEDDGLDEDDTYACDECGAREPLPAIRIFSEVEGQPMTDVAVCRGCFEKRAGGQIVASSVDEADVTESVPF